MHKSAPRKQYSSQFKATVALEAVKNHKTIAEIGCEYSVHPNQVGKWKKQLLEQLPLVFEDGRKKNDTDKQRTEAELYQQIGQMKMELDWLKKKVGLLG